MTYSGRKTWLWTATSAGMCLFSLATIITLTGCDAPAPTGGSGGMRGFDEKKDNVANPKAHEHEHEHGPHNGHIVELGGDDFHAEVTMDDKRTLTIYLLKSDLKTPLLSSAKSIRLNAKDGDKPKQIECMAAPQDGEKEGASRFQAAADALPASFEDLEDVSGQVAVTIADKEYSGTLESEHDHTHAKPAEAAKPSTPAAEPAKAPEGEKPAAADAPK